MATTTPNFGWPVPTSTDLVKDGATAIEGLGDAIDASLLDLKGGTSGQVLKKNSNTDMDFIWSADSAGMTNPMTTTGDTIYSSSGSTPARLGIGSTGQVLTVSGGIPTWATPAGGGGAIKQLVHATTGTKTEFATTTYTDVTGVTASITPASTSNSVLISVQVPTFVYRNTNQAIVAQFQLLRGTTVLQQWGRPVVITAGVGSASYIEGGSVFSFTYKDSPSTTSSTTYKIQCKASTTADNAGVSLNDPGSIGSSQASMTLMEI